MSRTTFALGPGAGAPMSLALSVGAPAAGTAALSRAVHAASVFGRAATTTSVTTAAMTTAPTTHARFRESVPVFSSVAAHGDAVSACGPVTTSRRDGGAATNFVPLAALARSGTSTRRAIRASVGAERSGANSPNAFANSPTSA